MKSTLDELCDHVLQLINLVGGLNERIIQLEAITVGLRVVELPTETAKGYEQKFEFDEVVPISHSERCRFPEDVEGYAERLAREQATTGLWSAEQPTEDGSDLVGSGDAEGSEGDHE